MSMRHIPETLSCGHAPTPTDGCGTGYGISADGRTSCYICCAAQTRAAMIADGRTVLCYDDAKQEVTDWPGLLRFRVTGQRFSPYGGGFGSPRTDVYFAGPDGMLWHGVQRGYHSQIARCRRLKVQP